MAQYTCTEMIAEVKAAIGRPNDSTLITDARVARWLNDAQEYIARKCVGLDDLMVKDSSTLSTVQDQLVYSLGGFDPEICHIQAIYYIDGDESKKLDFRMQDEFDEDWPLPSTHSTDKPNYWTHRGNNIELFPIPSSDYAGKTLRIDYTKYPATISGSDTSDITHADEGLIYYATYKAYKYLGKKYKDDASYSWATFEGWFKDFYEKHSAVTEWDCDTIFED